MHEEEVDDVDDDDEEYAFRVWFEKGEITIAEEEQGKDHFENILLMKQEAKLEEGPKS